MSKSLQNRPSLINLSLFIFSSPKSPEICPFGCKKSPRNFAAQFVGLGIVAAMNENGDTKDAKKPVSPKSDPIPICSGKTGTTCRRPVSEIELSESYTCVISHFEGESARKTEYFGESDGVDGNSWENSGMFSASPPPMVDFLRSCYLCRKKLNGIDIFMYRGDKAFCSVECRCQQILNDQHTEKCESETPKPFPCSVSPCLAPRLFSSGVAAA